MEIDAVRSMGILSVVSATKSRGLQSVNNQGRGPAATPFFGW